LEFFVSFAMPLIGVSIVIALAYFFTVWLAKKYAGLGSGKQMRVIESLALGTDRSLILVRVGEKVLLLGASGKNLEVLSEFEAREFPDAPENPETKRDFSKILLEAMKSRPLVEKLLKKRGGDAGGDDK